MDLDDREVARALAGLHVWPVDIAVARASVRLDFRAGPADGIIAVTSAVHNVPLVNRDRAIGQSKLVPLALAAEWHSRAPPRP